MSPAALIMMVIAILLVWGGLVASIVHLRSNPDDISGEGFDEDTPSGLT